MDLTRDPDSLSHQCGKVMGRLNPKATCSVLSATLPLSTSVRLIS